MQSHRKNSKIELEKKLNSISEQAEELFKNPGFLNAKNLVFSIISLLDIKDRERGKFSFLQDHRFIKNEPWFEWHNTFPDKRAGELLNHDEGIPLEIKVYWVNKISPNRIKGIVRFTDNFEDSARTRQDKNLKVGLDIIINPQADGFTLAISNYGVVRVLEIRGKLNNTQKKIFADWIEVGNGDYIKDRDYVHKSLWNSFEIKTVNEQFYLMISQAFTILKQHLEKYKIFNEDDSKQFSNRLIGRLLFIWFLRKKDFISDEKINYFNTDDLSESEYYTNRLEKLFFETLNKPIEIRDALHGDLKTPYLNGGLFYRYKNDIPKKDFSFPSNFFENLYKNLNGYNFTTDESTPDFEQVAIDPEMLGRIFENLLASMTTETGKQARKAKGAFYTPREIVQYICRESIRRHLYTKLDTDKYKLEIDRLIDIPDHEWAINESNKVRDVSKKNDFGKKVIEVISTMKVVDPACGSGAFPIGMLQTLLRIYSRLNRSSNEYETKIKILENNIYGVDIEPMAVEISRLRAFLALVVDQEYNEKNKNGGIDTLPNLEFKFVCANTLIKLSGQESFFDGVPENQKGKKKLDLHNDLLNIKRKYFKANWKTKQRLEEELDKKLLQPHLEESKKYKQLRSYHPIRQISPAIFYDAVLMHDVEDCFDIVIGNPPYVSTKGVDNEFKIDLEQEYGFADDLYSHFYFKGIELCKNDGILSYITSKTFWTIQSKMNLRDLLLTNNLLVIYDTDNPFKSAMVDTCVLLVQKNTDQYESIKFLKSGGTKDSIDYFNPFVVEVDKNIYKNAVNKVIFYPSKENLKIYNKYNNKVKELMQEWWLSINTSKKINTNKLKLDNYRNKLKPGDISLLGLLTEGGQGLATGNNGKYVGVLTTTKEAIKVKMVRCKKFFEFISKEKITKYGTSREKVTSFLNELSEKEIRDLFDSLKEKYGRDIFGQGFLYRIIDSSEVKDISKMRGDEKINGLLGEKTFVPYDKGDKDGNRWYLRTPYYIDWSIENVIFLKKDPKARYQGYNFYFRDGFCWSDIHTILIKTRLKKQSIHDVKSMSMFSVTENCTDKYLVCLLNSTFVSKYDFSFVNTTSSFQINDARQLPIIIPTKEQLFNFTNLFNRAYLIKNKQFDGNISGDQAKHELGKIQKELDEMVYKLYGIKQQVNLII